MFLSLREVTFPAFMGLVKPSLPWQLLPKRDFICSSMADVMQIHEPDTYIIENK